MLKPETLETLRKLGAQLTEEQARIQALINGIRLLLSDYDKPAQSSATPREPAPDPEPVGEDQVKRYTSEKWADRKVESLQAVGISAKKRFVEGLWEVSWKEAS